MLILSIQQNNTTINKKVKNNKYNKKICQKKPTIKVGFIIYQIKLGLIENWNFYKLIYKSREIFI